MFRKHVQPFQGVARNHGADFLLFPESYSPLPTDPCGASCSIRGSSGEVRFKSYSDVRFGENGKDNKKKIRTAPAQSQQLGFKALVLRPQCLLTFLLLLWEPNGSVPRGYYFFIIVLYGAVQCDKTAPNRNRT